MTRKDFELIADVVSAWSANVSVEDSERDELIERFILALSATNPQFDRRRFRAACKGV